MNEHLQRYAGDGQAEEREQDGRAPGKRSRVERRYAGRAPGATGATAVDRALAMAGGGAGHPSGARLHEGPEAAAAASQLGALAFTAGADVFLGGVLDVPGRDQVLAHELGHVAQARGVAAPRPGGWQVAARDSAEERAVRGDGDPAVTARAGTIYCTTLDDYRADERHGLQVSTTAGATQQTGAVTGGGATMTVTFRPTAPIVLGPGIPATMIGLLGQAAGRYQHDRVLTLGTVIERAVAVPATEARAMVPAAVPPAQGSAPPPDVGVVFRFTFVHHVAPAPPRGHPATGPADGDQILVELVGADHAPATTLPPGVDPANGGAVAIAGISVTTEGPWTAARLQSLQETVAALPPGLLPHVARIGFRVFDFGGVEAAELVPAGVSLGGQTIHPSRDTIVIQTSAFRDDATDARIGGHRPSVMTLAHELGHLLDSIDERRARAHADQVISQPRPINQPLTVAQATAAMSGVHRDSGMRERVTGVRGGTVDSALDDRTATTAGIPFRQAALQDGAHVAGSLTPRTAEQAARDGARGYAPSVDRTGGITAYSDEAWEEYYAEAFALFVADPATLRRLRPHLFTFFTTRTAHIAPP